MLVWKKISLFPCLLALIRVCSNSNFLPTSNPACLIELLVKGSFFLSAPKCKVFLSALLDKINFSSLPSINDVRFFKTFQPLPSFLLKNPENWSLSEFPNLFLLQIQMSFTYGDPLGISSQIHIRILPNILNWEYHPSFRIRTMLKHEFLNNLKTENQAMRLL